MKPSMPSVFNIKNELPADFFQVASTVGATGDLGAQINVLLAQLKAYQLQAQTLSAEITVTQQTESQDAAASSAAEHNLTAFVALHPNYATNTKFNHEYLADVATADQTAAATAGAASQLNSLTNQLLNLNNEINNIVSKIDALRTKMQSATGASPSAAPGPGGGKQADWGAPPNTAPEDAYMKAQERDRQRKNLIHPNPSSAGDHDPGADIT